MRITSTSAWRSRLAAATPPKPPPTITTRGRTEPGFRAGEWTYAHGHGEGYLGDIVVVAHATGLDVIVFDGEQEMAVLEGNKVIHGQSGGPVMTSREVTGVVNAVARPLPFSFSRELKDTVICQHS